MIDSTNLRLKVTCTTHGVVLVHGDDSWVRTLADGSLQFWSICPVGPHRMRQAPSAEEVAALVAEGVTVADAEASTVLTRIANEPHATVADTAAACITDKTKLRRVVSDAYGCAMSISLQIFCAYAPESEPPNTVKSCAKTKSFRPSTVPYPVMTPSPRTF